MAKKKPQNVLFITWSAKVMPRKQKKMDGFLVTWGMPSDQ